MKTLWIIENKIPIYTEGYTPATFSEIVAAFPTREEARKEIVELKNLDREFSADMPKIYYRAVKYVRAT